MAGENGFISGMYGDNPYYSLYNFGKYDYTEPGSGMMPGMAETSASYGSPQSMSYQAPGIAQDAARTGWKDMSGLDKMSAIGEGVQAFSTLASLYLGFKGLKEQRKQFKFQKSSWNKNFAAQLGAYDNSLRDNYEKYKMGNAYFGNEVEPEADWMSSRSLSHLGA